MMARSKRKRSEGEVPIRNIKARTEPTMDSLHEVMHLDESADEEHLSDNKDCSACGTHFSSAEAYRYHRETKLMNKTAKFLAVNRIHKKRHLLLCDTVMCCFSTKSKQTLKVEYFRLFLLFSKCANSGTYDASAQEDTPGFDPGHNKPLSRGVKSCFPPMRHMLQEFFQQQGMHINFIA